MEFTHSNKALYKYLPDTVHIFVSTSITLLQLYDKVNYLLHSCDKANPDDKIELMMVLTVNSENGFIYDANYLATSIY